MKGARIALLIGVLTATLWQARPHLRTITTSFPGYWLVAREVMSGTPTVQLYDTDYLIPRLESHGFPGDRMIGPPTLALTAIPVSGLDYPAARTAWLLGVLTPALAVSLVMLFAPSGWGGAGLAIAFALSRPVEANMAVGQIYPLMLALHCIGLLGWRRAQPAIGGAGLAVMILARGWYGLLQAFGWLVAGRPMGLIWTGGLTAGLGLMSVLVLGAEAWGHFLFVQVPQERFEETALVLAYQTWRSLALHLTTFHPALSPNPPLVGLGPWLWGVGAVGIASASAWAGRRLRPGYDRGGVGFAMWTCASLLLSPAAEDYHMVLTALPIAVLWPTGRRAQITILLALPLLLVDWGFDRPTLLGGWRSLLAYPRLYGVGLLWLAALDVARTLPQKET
ncbi:MAG: glycosyltransferase family 87 protein [Myxococcota bacterium]